MKSYGEYTWPMKNQEHRPFQHQVETTEFLLRNKRAFVLSDIGTGKTLCTLWATDILFHFGAIKKVLIICPLSTMKVVWAHEIFENFPHRRYAIAHGNRDNRIYAIQSNAHYVIINHDGIKSCPEELIKENFDVVIVDELTAFKNSTCDRSKTMRRIASKIKAVWGMTGAPTPNSPSEAFGQCLVVHPGNPFLPKYFTKFKRMVEVEITPYVWIPKLEAKDIVYKVMQPAVRYERDKCLDLPPVIHQEIEVGMSSDQQRAYDAIKNELYLEYEKGEIIAVNAAVKLSKLLQISAGSVIDNDGKIYHLNSNPKVESVLETFEELGRTKLIVVSAFRASVEELARLIQKEKINCEYIHGDVSSNRRANIINEFQHGKLQVLVVQPQAMSHGINLTASSTIVWHSFVASGETFMQMNGRITRAGQTKKQFVKYLVGSKAEKHILNILTKKVNTSTEILKLFSDRIL